MSCFFFSHSSPTAKFYPSAQSTSSSSLNDSSIRTQCPFLEKNMQITVRPTTVTYNVALCPAPRYCEIDGQLSYEELLLALGLNFGVALMDGSFHL